MSKIKKVVAVLLSLGTLSTSFAMPAFSGGVDYKNPTSVSSASSRPLSGDCSPEQRRRASSIRTEQAEASKSAESKGFFYTIGSLMSSVVSKIKKLFS